MALSEEDQMKQRRNAPGIAAQGAGQAQMAPPPGPLAKAVERAGVNSSATASGGPTAADFLNRMYKSADGRSFSDIRSSETPLPRSVGLVTQQPATGLAAMVQRAAAQPVAAQPVQRYPAGGAGATSIAPSPDMQRIQSWLASRQAESLDARARQSQATAASTAAEGQIAERNALENAARNAAQDSRSLRLQPGGKMQRMMMEGALALNARAAEVAGQSPIAQFIRTPEQEAALAQAPLQNRLQQQEADARTLVAGAEAAKATRGPQEEFDNAVDELDASGRPIRVQYGNLGTRRVIDEAQPMPKAKGSVTMGPNGELVYSDNSSPKLTETQSKDLNYYTRGTAALKNLEGNSQVLADPLAKAGASVPLVGNALSGEQYQQANQAGNEFLSSILRKDSGAAITRQEMEIYGKTYLPQPFDTPETLKQKAVARQTALEAIRSGMGPAQQLVPNADDETTAAGSKSYSHLWE